MLREEVTKKLLQEYAPASACSALFDREEDGMSILIRGEAKDGLSDGYLVIFQLEKAYDKVMMAQLTNRKKGVAFGSFKVSKDVKFADKEPIVPWGPRFTSSSGLDMKINLAIAAVFTAWIVFKRNAEYKPLQFLAFVFVYEIFEKLKAYEPTVSPILTEDGEDPVRGVRMGKRLLRSLALAFACIAFTSLLLAGIHWYFEFDRDRGRLRAAFPLQQPGTVGDCFDSNHAIHHGIVLQMTKTHSSASGPSNSQSMIWTFTF